MTKYQSLETWNSKFKVLPDEFFHAMCFVSEVTVLIFLPYVVEKVEDFLRHLLKAN